MHNQYNYLKIYVKFDFEVSQKKPRKHKKILFTSV